VEFYKLVNIKVSWKNANLQSEVCFKAVQYYTKRWIHWTGNIFRSLVGSQSIQKTWLYGISKSSKARECVTLTPWSFHMHRKWAY